MYALVNDTFGQPDRIVVHDATSAGNVAPLREIAGAAALLDQTGGIAFDAADDRIWITTGSQGGTARLLAFPRTANGNVAPSVIVTGAATGLDNPSGVHVFQPTDVIFVNSFE